MPPACREQKRTTPLWHGSFNTTKRSENVLLPMPTRPAARLEQVFKRGGQLLLRLGDTDVPFSDEFRFFVTTKLANPHYMPEICIKVTIINFTVTMTGLEDQLLVDVVKNERPDLEAKKDELVGRHAPCLRGLCVFVLKLTGSVVGG